ncbi:MAG: VWA domain-containing protein [Acidimicrobiia bacterium]|nr:VWA domain-containing protein [Acidimicrobiia bacterium]
MMKRMRVGGGLGRTVRPRFRIGGHLMQRMRVGDGLGRSVRPRFNNGGHLMQRLRVGGELGRTVRPRFRIGGYLMQRLRVFAISLLVSGAGLVLMQDTHPPAVAQEDPSPTDMSVTDKCKVPSDDPQINVLMLLDRSGSLNRTDPENERRAGVQAAISNLANLARTFDGVALSIAVDTFAEDYRKELGWAEAGIELAEARNLPNRATAADGHLTDYRKALTGAAQRFRDGASNDCNLLLWFTDGEHATDGSSSVISPSERAQLTDLCKSDAMRELAEKNLWTIAVLLDSGTVPVNKDPLKLMFAAGCEHALTGPDPSSGENAASSLTDSLDELINEAVYKASAARQSEDLLPGERSGLPAAGEFKGCSGGEGSVTSLCKYPFTLKPDHDGFRVFVDLTSLNRQISDPTAITTTLRSPKGTEYPLDFDVRAGYERVGGSGFLFRKPYDSRWELIGHQAAKQIANRNSWEWAGEWTLEFSGTTPTAAEDAAKVAAAVRTVEGSPPEVTIHMNDSMGSLTGNVGVVTNQPIAYKMTEYRLGLNDISGGPVNPARPTLWCRAVCRTLTVNEGAFEIPMFYEQVFDWADGDKTRLLKILNDSGGIYAVAELTQSFKYGPEDLEWKRPLGEPIPLANLANWLESRLSDEERFQQLSSWLTQQEPPALPSLQWTDSPLKVDNNNVEFQVVAIPGRFSAVVTLKDITLKDITLEKVTAPLGEPEVLNADWKCEVPKYTLPRYTTPCPAILVDTGVNKDSELVATLHFLITRDSYANDEIANLGEGATEPSPEEWATLRNKIAEAAAPVSQPLTSETFRVDIVTFGDRISKFLPLLVILFVLAAASRVFVAWRLRPWKALDSPEYVVKPLQPAFGHEPSISEQRELCMELNTGAASATVGFARLSSSWLPLLLGRPPAIVATASGNDCVGPKGSMRNKKDQQVALIGPTLRKGWLVVGSKDAAQLIVWDLPNEESEQEDVIAQAEQAATDALDKSRKRENRERQSETTNHGESQETVPNPFADDTTSTNPFAPPSSYRDPFAD